MISKQLPWFIIERPHQKWWGFFYVQDFPTVPHFPGRFVLHIATKVLSRQMEKII